MKRTTGIDFGTTNSTTAIADANGARLVPIEGENVTIPTAIYFPENGARACFGRDAINQYITGADGRLMRSLKRILGTNLMQKVTIIGGARMSYFSIISEFICHLKNKIDTTAGTGIDSVVMGRPVHFRDEDPDGDARAEKELREIAKSAGFKNIEFQFEPIAAAFAHEQKITDEKLALVIDIGGGTSDFTIVRLSPNRKDSADRRADILASTGIRIGGNDFDKDLSLASFMPVFGMGSQITGTADKLLTIPSAPYFSLSTWSEINDLYTYQSLNKIDGYFRASKSPELVARLVEIARQNLGHKNLGYVEETKIKLSDAMSTEISLDFLTDAPRFTATRQDFDNAIERDVLKISRAIDECLGAAAIRAGEINLVILTGGSTEIPRINNLARTYFPSAEFSMDDKLSSVGLGLAFDSRRRF